MVWSHPQEILCTCDCASDDGLFDTKLAMDDRRHFNNFDCIFDTLAMLEYAASLVALGGGAAKEAGDDVEGAVVEAVVEADDESFATGTAVPVTDEPVALDDFGFNSPMQTGTQVGAGLVVPLPNCPHSFFPHVYNDIPVLSTATMWLPPTATSAGYSVNVVNSGT